MRKSDSESKVKILFLAANPDRTRQLHLEEEIDRISKAIRAAEYRDRLELTPKWDVQPQDLGQVLLAESPEIVHFSGHADPSGILLNGGCDVPRANEGRQHHDRDLAAGGGPDGSSQPRLLPGQGLIALLRALSDDIKVVVLNACGTRQQVQAIAKKVKFAIGWSEQVRDDAAIAFAASFYGTLAFGRSVQMAFDLGKAGLLLEGLPAHTPHLYVRKGSHAATTVLIGRGSSPVSRVFRSRNPSEEGTEARFRSMDRSSLEAALGALSPTTFERFVAWLDDPAIQLRHGATVAQKVSELLSWADTSTERKWEAIRDAFRDFWSIPPPADLVSHRLAAALRKNYAKERSLGIGAISQVVLFRDRQLRRDVAVKVLTDPEYGNLFDGAVRDVARVTKHPNIVSIYGATLGEWEKREGGPTTKNSIQIHYYMREYIDGESLRSKLDDEDPIRSITFVHQVLAAVGEAISVVQTNIEDDLDINPEHILIQPIASGLRSHPSHEYKIMVSPDTVRVSALVRELNHKAVAKLIYSPPECLRDSSCGEASRDWANQYRLGIIGYEMLVGSSAFSRMARERSEILVKFREDHTAADLPELPAIASLCPRGCPQFLRQPVERMTRMRPEERFRTLSEAVSAVAHLDFEVEVALDSYNRIVSDVTSEWNFFKKFYDRFLTECPSAAGEFHRFPPIRPSLGDPGSSQFERSWPDQYRKLKHAIVALFTFKLVGKSDGVTILTGIADFHVGYPEEYYSAFRQALLKTVEECDNIERSGLLPERLRAAWAKAVDPGIEYMVAHTKERARSAGR